MLAMLNSRRVGLGALLLLPGALVAYFAFFSGGYYPAATAYAAMLLSVVAAIRALTATDPFAGFGWWLTAGAGALALYALLTLLSGGWSHAPSMALTEYDLPLVYVLAMVICGSIAHRRHRVAWVLRLLALAIVAVCVCGLITRLLPNVWPIAAQVANNRLSFPVTYWNALGLLAALGIVLCVHLSSAPDEPRVTRVLGATGVPVLALTLYFTFSRGGIASGVIALAVYLLLGRPRLLASTVLAVVPTTIVALKFAYDANLLATQDPTSRAAIQQGHHVAVALLVCILVTAGLRLALVWLDLRLGRFRLHDIAQRRVRRIGWTSLVVVAAILLAVFNGTISNEYHRFLRPQAPGSASDLRSRLTDPGNNGRVDLWKVAWHGFTTAPAVGHGAGTFANTWFQKRTDNDFVHDAHSLYLETMDELGIVGLILLLISILTVLVRVATRARGRDRPLYAAVFAVLLGWALHAGVDWDWEMPVLTVIFFSLGGLVLARDKSDQPGPGVASITRVQVAVGCLVLAVAPTYVWLSQRPLNAAVSAFSVSNCRVATREAVSSLSTLGTRPQAYQILSFCDVRQGEPLLAIDQIKQAISLDPGNWEYTYSLALMRAAAGLDPRAMARRALELDPKETLTQDAWRLLRNGNPTQWEAIGRQLTNQFTTLPSF